MRLKKTINRLSSVSLAIVAAVIFASGFFLIAMLETTRAETAKRSRLIDMTDSFVSVFAEQRGAGAPVPATFRRMGIEHFTTDTSDSDDAVGKVVRMPGRPGLELHTREEDPRVRAVILDFVTQTAPGEVQEHRLESGRLIGRTISPSIATSESCVSCHNATLGEGTYRLGDVMGAFVVESDLTKVAVRNGYYAFGAFLVASVAFGLLARRERNRMGEVLQGLKTRVRLEQLKTKAEAQARFLMSHDALTGLANRSMFRDRLASELDQPSASDVTVALIDMDDFKAVNDTLGHAAGDALLVEVGKRLTDLVKTCDGLVSRLGGDEFAIVLGPTGYFPTPASVGRAIVTVMEDSLTFENNVIYPRCSIGIARADDFETPSQQKLLQGADAALYAAKAGGRKIFQVYDDDIRASAGRRADIAAALPGAISDMEIGVALQPKVALADGQLVGFEALARWQMDGEAVSPEEFTAIAEETGLICQLDLAVLRSAAVFAAQEEQETGIAVHVSANISAVDFRTPDLAEKVLDVLMETGLDPSRLTIEVTESTAVENWETVKEVLSALRQHGVRASLDDFGIGYSSLSYLRLFGFEEIKIDRGFITNITDDAETRFLFESIVDMANGLGSSVVVEGIETKEQADIVGQKAAVIGQGYLYAKPLEVDAARAYLRNHKRSVA